MNTITLELNIDQLNIVLYALRKLPFETVEQILPEIISQAQKQLPNGPQQAN
jgi:hypothetical protein